MQYIRINAEQVDPVQAGNNTGRLSLIMKCSEVVAVVKTVSKAAISFKTGLSAFILSAFLAGGNVLTLSAPVMAQEAQPQQTAPQASPATQSAPQAAPSAPAAAPVAPAAQAPTSAPATSSPANEPAASQPATGTAAPAATNPAPVNPAAQSSQSAPSAATPAQTEPAGQPVSIVPEAGQSQAAAPVRTADNGLQIPHDLSPWGMFMAADWVVKAVMIGLAIASLATWTVWLAKTLEITGARSRARRALKEVSHADNLASAVQALDKTRGPGAHLVRAAQEEVTQSASAAAATALWR